MAATALGLSLFACSNSDHTSPRDQVDTQNDAAADQKKAELTQVQGTYRGTLHLEEINQDVDCLLELKVFTETIHSPNAQAPTETARLPKLTGTMQFPILDSLNASGGDAVPADTAFRALLNPLADYHSALIDYGDFEPRTGNLVLPYSVPNYSQGSFGEFDASFASGVVSGSWYAKPFGTVGTFRLTRQAGGAR